MKKIMLNIFLKHFDITVFKDFQMKIEIECHRNKIIFSAHDYVCLYMFVYAQHSHRNI